MVINRVVNQSVFIVSYLYHDITFFNFDIGLAWKRIRLRTKAIFLSSAVPQNNTQIPTDLSSYRAVWLTAELLHWSQQNSTTEQQLLKKRKILRHQCTPTEVFVSGPTAAASYNLTFWYSRPHCTVIAQVCGGQKLSRILAYSILQAAIFVAFCVPKQMSMMNFFHSFDSIFESVSSSLGSSLHFWVEQL